MNGSQDVRQGAGGNAGQLTRPTKPTTTTIPCKISQISADCHSILTNIQFSPTWNGVQKTKWCNSAGAYFTCLKVRLVNCYGVQFAESVAYYEKIQKYIHSQANVNCPGGLEGCVANPNDVRCKMGVKYGETNGTTRSPFKNEFEFFIVYLFTFLILFIINNLN